MDPAVSPWPDTDASPQATAPLLELQSGPVAPDLSTLGRYRLLARQGAGGMGIVHAAHDPVLERRVAIKLLHDVSGSDLPALREARALARVSDPHVVQVFEVDVVDDRVYLVLEFVPGPTLAEWLAAGPRDPAEVADLFLQAGRGLAAVHRAGLVHRDFKPANVIVGDDGRVRVVDFGLARATRGDPPRDDVTTAPDVPNTAPCAGTPRYMSPEQRIGRSIDARSDQYSFCVAAHEALLGRLPPAPPPGQPLLRRLHRVLARGLAAAPADRWPDMDALCAALARAVRPRRWPWAVAGGGFVLGVALVLGGQPEGGTRCDPEPRLAAVWSPEARSGLAARLPAAADAVDRRAARWSDLYTAACTATHVRGEQSTTLFELQVECFDTRLAELDAALRGFADADADAALETLALLPALEQCRDNAAMRRAADPVRRARARDEDPALRRQFTDTRALVRGADVDRYRAGLTRVLADAGDPSDLRAEALLARGLSHRALGEANPARDDLLAAHRGARDLGRTDLAARAAAALAVQSARLASDPNAAAVWAELALAEVDALRDEGLLRADVLVELADAALAVGDWARADRHLTAARALRERHLGPGHSDVALVLARLGEVRRRQGRHHDAIDVLSGARALLAANGEAALPRYGGLEVDLAIALTWAGRHDEALVLMEPQLARTISRLGDEHLNAHRLRQHVARARAGLGQHAEALALRSRSHAAYRGRFGARSLWTAEAALDVARSSRAVDDAVAALPAAQAALEARSALLGESADDTGEARVEVAHTLLDVGRVDEAEALLAPAAAAIVGDDPASRPLAFAWARVRRARGDVTAVARAEELRAALVGDDLATADLRRDLSAWLAAPTP
ncbi:MAG: serine/threonine protein kinase [Myxococcales bacterium]|nr:serine/threonine protein kinase [Myxococcales bacterium]